MPPLDSWLEIVIRTPLLLLLLIVLVFIGLVASGIFLYRRGREQMRILIERAQQLRAQSAGGGEVGWAAREAYRHFIYNISHEVSNPLQSIQTNLDNMARCPPGEPDRWRQYHSLITAEVRRLTALTQNLRLLAHLETPDAPLEREPVNLKGVIEEVIMALFERAESCVVRLRYVGSDRPGRVLGDRERLRQVLTNLVENGIKYCKPEGGEVIISVLEEQGRLLVRVSDEGLGIAAEDLPHIFDTAYRAPEARSFRRGGTGLGLAIAQRIVNQHGGEIRVVSQPGAGSTFSFDLPLAGPPAGSVG
jgi:signal transduction histidine kinase